ncbi:universal stress protein [Nonomuraea sp. NPDC049129]|uniref:universal stress protein n=1 Tax=Nonomuraea sp. NPDC049129 TaxID=3155272 RepID=UPI0033D0B7C4
MSDRYAGRPILVGYDDSPESGQALRWAVEEARLRRLPLLVCHVWHWPYALRPVAPEVLAQIEQVAGGVVDDGVRRARNLAPAPPITGQPGDPGRGRWIRTRCAGEPRLASMKSHPNWRADIPTYRSRRNS